MPESTDRLERGTVSANSLAFSYLACGPADGELALCLHGFPDSAWTWRYLLPALADTGYRAVAPWQRGYAPTEVPADGRYQSGALAADACALHEALSPNRAGVIIGHDWGAFAAYGAAAHRPGQWRQVVTAAVPPVGALAEAFFSYYQLKRSWYMFFFQSPLAETAVGMDDLAFLGHLWADWSPGYDGSADVEWVKESLRNPDNLSAAISYYRAMFDPTRQVPELVDEQAATMAPTPQPLLYIHGVDDGCLSIDLARAAETGLTPPSRMHPIEGAGHFMNVEKPEAFNAAVLEFLGPARS